MHDTTLIGLYVLIPDVPRLTEHDQWMVDRQGQIIGIVEGDNILIQLHRWTDGNPDYCVTWPLHRLEQLHICLTHDDYIEQAEKHSKRWD